ncbi:multiple epidermal growth factor-like domains protein 10 isoform X1 [Euwallacea similis]|uniref:multiple epidermal growth factor-like domains protein 10 isoform X1 n=1 Tax=Euwallacea similis TaxID=1736056 RepID=UPI00344E8004
MKEKVGESVMECTDLIILVCLLMVCGTTTLLAQQRQDLNGRCLHVSQCNRVGYFCSSNRTCQCGPGYKPNRQWTKCIGHVGSRCVYDSQCIEGAYCTGTEGWEMCRCREQDDYYPSEDNLFCINRPIAGSSGSAVGQFWNMWALSLGLSGALYLNT